MGQLLSQSEIHDGAKELSGYSVEGKEIRCQRTFKYFVEAIAFVNQRVGGSSRRKTVTLTSHDAGGLTKKNFQMVNLISALD